MAVFPFKRADKGERLQALAQQTGKRLSARSKYLGHMAAAQSYRAAAGARSTADRAGDYIRRHRGPSLGLLAGIASLIGFAVLRRRIRKLR